MKAIEKKALLIEELNLAKLDGTLESVVSAYNFIVKDNFVEVKRDSSLFPPEVLSELFKQSSGNTVSTDSSNGDMFIVDILELNQPSDEYISKVLDTYKGIAEERATQNMSIIINEDLFDNARVNLNNSVF